MTDTSVKIDNEEIMINCPDGFDARTIFFIIQLCLHGISKKHPINLVFSINNVLFANPTMETDSKLP